MNDIEKLLSDYQAAKSGNSPDESQEDPSIAKLKMSTEDHGIPLEQIVHPDSEGDSAQAAAALTGGSQKDDDALGKGLQLQGLSPSDTPSEPSPTTPNTPPSDMASALLEGRGNPRSALLLAALQGQRKQDENLHKAMQAKSLSDLMTNLGSAANTISGGYAQSQGGVTPIAVNNTPFKDLQTQFQPVQGLEMEENSEAKRLANLASLIKASGAGSNLKLLPTQTGPNGEQAFTDQMGNVSIRNIKGELVPYTAPLTSPTLQQAKKRDEEIQAWRKTSKELRERGLNQRANALDQQVDKAERDNANSRQKIEISEGQAILKSKPYENHLNTLKAQTMIDDVIKDPKALGNYGGLAAWINTIQTLIPGHRLRGSEYSNMNKLDALDDKFTNIYSKITGEGTFDPKQLSQLKGIVDIYSKANQQAVLNAARGTISRAQTYGSKLDNVLAPDIQDMFFNNLPPAVEMKSPSGKTGYIKKENIQNMMNQGYTISQLPKF